MTDWSERPTRGEAELQADLEALGRSVAQGAFSDALLRLRNFAYPEADRRWALPRGLARALGDPHDVLALMTWGFGQADRDVIGLMSELAAGLPWIAYLPDPRDALVNLARQAHERGVDPAAGGEPVRVTLRWPEDPSAQLALAFTLGRRVDLAVETIPDPDPRSRCPTTPPSDCRASGLVAPTVGSRPGGGAAARRSCGARVVSTRAFYPISDAFADAHRTLRGPGPTRKCSSHSPRILPAPRAE